jgi:hypothetical protein
VSGVVVGDGTYDRPELSTTAGLWPCDSAFGRQASGRGVEGRPSLAIDGTAVCVHDMALVLHEVVDSGLGVRCVDVVVRWLECGKWGC